MFVRINILVVHSLIVLFCFYSNNISASPEIKYIVEGDNIFNPLGGLEGDPRNGRELVRNKNKGNCLSCHHLPIPEDDFHGTIGPSLIAVSQRLTESQIRLRVTDMKQVNPNSIMPGFFRGPEKMNRISSIYENTTILSAQDIEDIVSYLITLKTIQTKTF
ncbi:MAG: sulfur oxidation c-type cytochrome SoxX [Gammaproteobacteria bacterium]|nr:sulfur oxidation c-type cytochrome SoxX [Gammaproteobacteria bacterium]